MEDNRNRGEGRDNYGERRMDRDEIYSKRVNAGKKRTYYFDIKPTRSNDYYITVTESKKKYNKDDDGFTSEKHKIFLYKEDFNKFRDAFLDTIDYAKKELMADVDFDQFDRYKSESYRDSIDPRSRRTR